MKSVHIPMQPDNISAILQGRKTTTIRSETAAKLIGLATGETGLIQWQGRVFKATLRGAMNVDQAGGREVMIRSEGYQSEADFKYKQSVEWLKGRSMMYVYDIAPINSRS